MSDIDDLIRLATIIEARLKILQAETPMHKPFPCASFLPELTEILEKIKTGDAND